MNSDASMFAGVIFDMDGLVIDSEAGYGLAWRRAAADLGYELSQAFCDALSGANGTMVKQRICRHLGAGFDWNAFAERSGELWRRQAIVDGIPLKPGFVDLVDVLRRANLPFCLATNSRRADAEQSLAWAGIADVFSVKVTRDDVARPKPAPDVFLQASKRLNLPPSRCLVLEDSSIGIEAALAAGCLCIGVPSQVMDESARPDGVLAIVKDLHQVAQWISSLVGDSL